MIFERQLIELALAEDLGLGDITTDCVVPSGTTAVAKLIAREPMVVAGTELISEVFSFIPGNVQTKLTAKDGQKISKGDSIATLSGDAQAILKGERLVLNFLRKLCGIANFTAQCVQIVEGTDIKVCDTRKTTPGWRRLEKMAVRLGGGHNHRFSLSDTMMIKDNHIACHQSIAAAVERGLSLKPGTSKIQVEVDSIEQLQTIVKYPIDMVLLDNMTPNKVEEAIKIIPEGILIEVSGGIHEGNLGSYRHLPVHRISMGCLTGANHQVDIGLDFEPAQS